MALNIAVFGAFLLIAAVLGFFLWKTLFASEEYSHRQEQSEPTYSEQQSSQENALGSSTTPSKGNATEEAIADYTKWLAIFTLFLVLATIALFISGERNIDVARESARSAKVSAQAAKDAAKATSDALKFNRKVFEFTERPWIAITDMSIVGPLHYDAVNKALKITIRYILKNTGRAPAKNVMVNPRIYAILSNIRDEQKKICDEARKNDHPFGVTIFPGETSIPQDIQVMIDQTQIANSLGPPERKVISPIIIGCVDYRLISSNEHHQTGFAVWVQDIGGGYFPFDSTQATVADIPVERMRLTMWVEGWFAD